MHWISEDFGHTYEAVKTPGDTLGYGADIKIHPTQPDWVLSLVRRNECLKVGSQKHHLPHQRAAVCVRLPAPTGKRSHAATFLSCTSQHDAQRTHSVHGLLTPLVQCPESLRMPTKRDWDKLRHQYPSSTPPAYSLPVTRQCGDRSCGNYSATNVIPRMHKQHISVKRHVARPRLLAHQ